MSERELPFIPRMKGKSPIRRTDPSHPDTSAEREIFAAVAALPPEERAAYLDASCAASPELRVSIEAWWAEHEAGGFMRAEDEPDRWRVE